MILELHRMREMLRDIHHSNIVEEGIALEYHQSGLPSARAMVTKVVNVIKTCDRKFNMQSEIKICLMCNSNMLDRCHI